MVNRIRLENFKSFRSLDLELGGINLLVGPNMSGKSNLLDAFRFLLSLLTSGSAFPLQQVINQRNGFGEVLWKGSSNGQVKLGLDGWTLFGGKRLDFSYDIGIGGSVQHGTARVQAERLSVIDDAGRQDLITTQGNERTLYKGGQIISQVTDPNSVALQYTLPDWPAAAVQQSIIGARFYNLIPPVMRNPNPSTAAEFLMEHGDNLSAWLMTLQTRYQEAFSRIRSVVRDVFPSVQNLFSWPTQQSTVYVSSQEEQLLRPTPLSAMSDGELAFLAWTSLILAPKELGAELYLIEEPENHLHPRLIEVMFELLRQVRLELKDDAVPLAQIMVTTHSPFVVDKCSIDELIVVSKAAGESKCLRPSDKDQFREMIDNKSLTLGDLYFSGALNFA